MSKRRREWGVKMKIKLRNLLLVLSVLCGNFVWAKVSSQLFFDQAQAIITIPVGKHTDVTSFFSVARTVIAVLADKQVGIEVRGYVVENATLRQKAQIQGVVQRLEHYLQHSMPGAQITQSIVDTVYEPLNLPAWGKKQFKSAPIGYVAIVVIPLDVQGE